MRASADDGARLQAGLQCCLHVLRLRRATLRLSLVYWACMFVADSILGGHFINIDALESAPLKFVLFGLSALMTYAMSLLLFRLRSHSFMHKALLCFAMTAVAAPLFTAIDFFNYMLCQYPEPVRFDPLYSGYTLLEGASMLFGWSCLFVALLYNFEYATVNGASPRSARRR